MPLLAAWMYTYRLQPTAHVVAVPGWAPCMAEEAFPSVRSPSLWCTQTKESKACHCLQPGCIVQAATNGTPCGCARLGSLHDRRGVPFSTCPQFVVHSDEGI